MSTPTPANSDVYMEGISCASTTSCIAVGSAAPTGTSDPAALSEAWDGSSWSVLTNPVLASGTTDVASALSEVDCASASFCTAVGYTVSEVEGDNYFQALVEEWEGLTWTVVPNPDVGAGGYDLNGVSCTSSSNCLAVGSSGVDGSGLQDSTVAETWNGSTWTELTSPNAGGQSGSNLYYSLSCTSPSECVAVGSANDEAGTPASGYTTLIEQWNGWSWAIAPSADAAQGDSGLSGVSCPGGYCMAVGYSDTSPTSDVPLSESFK
jgi:hypothetical protein